MLSKLAASSNKGFTLIEVLVASVILFSTIAVSTLVYQTALSSSLKATRHTNINNVIPSILSLARDDIRKSSSNDVTGSGNQWGVIYKFSAVPIQQKSPVRIMDVDSGNLVDGEYIYILWEVSLELTYDGFSKTFMYKEVSWRSRSY